MVGCSPDTRATTTPIGMLCLACHCSSQDSQLGMINNFSLQLLVYVAPPSTMNLANKEQISGTVVLDFFMFSITSMLCL